jgi:long-chain acyl-CoA synthetase
MGEGTHHLAVLAEQAQQRGDPGHRSVWFEDAWYTAGELFDRVQRLATGLADLGVGPGDRVVVMMATTPDVGVTYQACWRAGAVATPVIFLLPPAELRHILLDSEPRAVITTEEFLPTVQQAAEGLDVTIVVDGDAEGTTPLRELTSAEPGGIVARGDDDLAALMYTGGTTGRSKGVKLSHEALWHAGRAGYEATADDHLSRTAVPLPLSHAFGLLATVTGMHQPEQGVAALMRWFDPAGFLDIVEQHAIEQATLVPTMLRMLLDMPLEERDLSSLVRVVCGSAPLPLQVLETFERRVPGVTICEGYGLTETSAAATVNRRHDRRVGTVGQPLPGVELKIVDDGGEEVPQGEAGEVLVRSRSNAQGYWGAPRESAATFVGGWVRTGDIGSLGPDGHLTILDRAKDVILRNGFNVYPRDVEEALTEHEAVASAAVVGRDDERVGEEIVAFVQPQPGVEIDEDELAAWARERLGPKSYPRELVTVEALPLTPVLKIDRKALRDRL